MSTKCAAREHKVVVFASRERIECHYVSVSLVLKHQATRFQLGHAFTFLYPSVCSYWHICCVQAQDRSTDIRVITGARAGVVALHAVNRRLSWRNLRKAGPRVFLLNARPPAIAPRPPRQLVTNDWTICRKRSKTAAAGRQRSSKLTHPPSTRPNAAYSIPPSSKLLPAPQTDFPRGADPANKGQAKGGEHSKEGRVYEEGAWETYMRICRERMISSELRGRASASASTMLRAAVPAPGLATSSV